MAWSIPKTWSASDELTAADMNTHVRDNLAFLGTRPSCQLTHSTTQTIPDAVPTMLTWDTEVFDVAAMHSTSTNPSRITIPTTAMYAVSATVQWTANTTGGRAMELVVNGSEVIAANDSVTWVGNMSVACVACRISAGAYVEVRVTQDSTESINVLRPNSYRPGFSVAQISF